jgi:hypothetical protein
MLAQRLHRKIAKPCPLLGIMTQPPSTMQRNVRFSLDPVGEGETLLTQTLDFQMKFGPVGALMDTLGFRPQFRK